MDWSAGLGQKHHDPGPFMVRRGSQLALLLCFAFLCEHMGRKKKARLTIFCLLLLLEARMNRFALPDTSLQAAGRLSMDHSLWWLSWGVWGLGLCVLWGRLVLPSSYPHSSGQFPLQSGAPPAS